MPFSPSASLMSALSPAPLSKLSPMEFYLCPPPGMWCLSRSQLRPWRLPAYQRGPRCMVGSLWSPWKSRLSEGRAARPKNSEYTLWSDSNYYRSLCHSLHVCCAYIPVPVWWPSAAAGQHVWPQVAAPETAYPPQLSILPPLHAVNHKQILTNRKKCVVHCQKYPSRNSRLTSSNFFVLARSQTWFIMRMRLLRPQSGWSSWKRN